MYRGILIKNFSAGLDFFGIFGIFWFLFLFLLYRANFKLKVVKLGYISFSLVCGSSFVDF